MTGISGWAVVGLIVIFFALLLWIVLMVRAQKKPDLSRHPGELPKRGDVSGGVIRGDPGQGNSRHVAPRMDDPPS